MSSKSTAASVKTSGNSSKAVKGWSAEENIQMLLMILKHSNPDLAVTGWNEIGKVAQEVFGGKYTGSAVKQQFRKLRLKYLAESGGNDATGNASAKAPSKARKRAAASDADDGDDEEGAMKQRKPRGRPAKKAKAKFEDDEEELNDDAQDEDVAIEASKPDTAGR